VRWVKSVQFKIMSDSTNNLKVISASRRIDMVGCYPDEFVQTLEKKCPPENVHTLVIWTKNATNLFKHPALSFKIKQYSQLHIHYTVTGMGESFIEPAVPSTEQAMNMLPQIIELAGSPLRVRFRFDPIVHFCLPDGKSYCNFPIFKTLAPQIAELGIKDVSISWMSEYKKVINRLVQAKIKVAKISRGQLQEEAETILRIANQYNLNVHGCCVPGLPQSKCIDGELYNGLHPKGLTCSTKKAKGQRKTCGCTESWDIGWYFKCLHGCMYCYANPV